MAQDDDGQLRSIFAAAKEHSTDHLRRQLNDCLSSFLQQTVATTETAIHRTMILSTTNHTNAVAVSEEPDSPPILIRALKVAHRKIHTNDNLKVLLESLSDPTVIPLAFLCSNVIPQFIVPEYILCKTTSMNQSATILIQQLLRWMDQYRCLASPVMQAIRQASMHQHERRSHKLTPILIELYLHLFRAFSNLRISIISALSDLLTEQYVKDASAVATHSRKGKHSRCDQVDDFEISKPKKRQRRLDLNQLHDGEQSDPEDVSRINHPSQRTGDATSPGMVGKKMADFTSSLVILRTIGDLCHRMMTLSSHYEALSPRCSGVRSLIASIILSGGDLDTTAPHNEESVRENHMRRSIRLLCALMIVNFKPQVLMTLCLQRYRHQEFLSYYMVELMTECRFYDDKRQLLAVVDGLSVRHASSQPLWKWLCTKRGKLLEQTTNEDILHLLHKNSDRLPESQPSLLGIRATVDAISPLVKVSMKCPKDFFSIYSPENRVPPQQYTQESKQTGRLTDECWLHIAMFLNYKRVVKLRLLNSAMKEIIDKPIVWKNLYEIRYPPYKIEQNRAQTLFRDRISAERSIRGRDSRGDPSFRVHLCPIPGCLHVLTTRNRAATHAKSHKGGSKLSRRRSAAQQMPMVIESNRFDTGERIL